MSFSSILERDLLGSARTTIDANSNANLTTSLQHNTYRTVYTGSTPLPYTGSAPLPYTCSAYPFLSPASASNNDAEMQKLLNDLQDQNRMLKKDLEKKDDLIKELALYKDANRHVHFEKDRYESLMTQDRTLLDGNRRELEQYRLKNDSLSHDLRDANIKLSAKDERINELKQEVDSAKRDQESLLQITNQLRSRIRELESNANSHDLVTNKSSLTIVTMQKELKEKQDELFELKARLRTYVEQRETHERATETERRKIKELFASLSVTLGGDYGESDAAGFDKVISRIADINAENTLLKGRMLKFEETNRTLEIEVKAHRATIDQMTNQLQSFDRNHYGHRYQIDVIKAERDAALNDKENLKHELETVKSRLDSIQKAWQNARGELDQRETRFSSTELHFKQMENDLTYTKSCFDAFKQQISQLLSDGYVKVEAKEDEIKEKIRLLMQSSKDRGIIITNLQNQKEQLAKQLQDQFDLQKDVEKKRRHQESHLHELEHRIQTLDSNYASTEAMRESFKQDKAKFHHFLERLAMIFKLETYSMELNPDVLLTRAEQLMKLENDSLIEQKNSTNNYQRKIQHLKEQLENKDVHLDLLRKKLASVEDGRTNKSELEREIDNHVVLSRKMKSKVEILTQQVNELRHENTQLKAQINDHHTLKDRLIEREKEIRRLLDDISKLENTRDKQAVKISSLQDRMHAVDDDVNRTLVSSDNAVRNLSNELRFLKGSLAQVTEREQRLLDFRALIARMLGLDAKTLSVPDYEITARLERLLHVAQPNLIIPAVQIPNPTKPTSAPQHHHHVHHHPQAVRSAQGRRRSPLSPTSRRAEASQRARSLSPFHVGIDPKTY